MIFFGHEGPVLGAAWLGYRLLKDSNSSSAPAKQIAGLFKNRFDFRILLLGAILPDLLDKPLGLLIFRDEIAYGRIYAHTLLFFLLLLSSGLWTYIKRKKTWLVTLALGVSGHLLLDDIWNAPVTLFWPLLGTQFPTVDLDFFHLPAYIWEVLLRNASILVVELAGFFICLIFFIDLLQRKKFQLFMRKGIIDEQVD